MHDNDEEKDEDLQGTPLSEQELEDTRLLRENGYIAEDGVNADDIRDEDPNADDPDNDMLSHTVSGDERDGTE